MILVYASEEMTCQELVEVVSDYLDGTLPDRERRPIEAHLRECPSCAEYVAQMRLTVSTLGQLAEETLEPSTRERLVEAFRRCNENVPRRTAPS